MAWYDSAGPAGAGFLKANQMFSEMNSREFENMLRQAQAQQLMQNMAQAPEEMNLKREHQNYLMQELASRNQPKRMSPLDELNAEEQMLINQGLRAKLPFIAEGESLENLRRRQQTSPEYQLLQDIKKARALQGVGSESTETQPVPYGSIDDMAAIYGGGLELPDKEGKMRPAPISPYGGSSWLKPWTWPTFTGAPKYTESEVTRILQAARKGQFKSKVPTPKQIIENLK